MKSWLHPMRLGWRGIDVGQPLRPHGRSHGQGLMRLKWSSAQIQLLAFMRDIINSMLALRSALTFCMWGRSPIIFK